MTNEKYRAWLDGLKPGDEVAVWQPDGKRIAVVTDFEHINYIEVSGDSTYSMYRRQSGCAFEDNSYYIRPNTPEDIQAETTRRELQQYREQIAERVKGEGVTEEQLARIEGVLDGKDTI